MIIKNFMAWYNSTEKENHTSLFDNVEFDCCIFCGGKRTEIARTDFTIMFSDFKYNTGSICKTCYHANAKQVKGIKKHWEHESNIAETNVLALLTKPL